MLKGVLYLFLVPTLILVFTFFALFLSLIDFFSILVIAIYSLLLFFTILLGKNAYTDLEVLEMVEVPNAPEKIKDMLKKQTIRHRPINISLISILSRRKKLSQSDLVKCVRKTGVELSHPAIAKYISDLVKLRIFDCREGPHKKEYVLTDKGKWCYKAIKKCFPKRFFFFVIRHYLGFRSLPQFPENNQNLLSNKSD